MGDVIDRRCNRWEMRSMRDVIDERCDRWEMRSMGDVINRRCDRWEIWSMRDVNEALVYYVRRVPWGNEGCKRGDSRSWFMVYGSDKKPPFWADCFMVHIKTFAADSARECVLVSLSFASHKISRFKKTHTWCFWNFLSKWIILVFSVSHTKSYIKTNTQFYRANFTQSKETVAVVNSCMVPNSGVDSLVAFSALPVNGRKKGNENIHVIWQKICTSI